MGGARQIDHPVYRGVAMQCDECGREADVEAHGWKAFVTRYAAVEETEHPQLALYCPECAEREFGDAGAELSD